MSLSTPRRWQKNGKLMPIITEGGHRRYDLSKLIRHNVHQADTNESHRIRLRRSQTLKNELERQKHVLKLFCTQNVWSFEIVSDRGSGMKLSQEGSEERIEHHPLVLTHQGRLLRSGRSDFRNLRSKK